MLSEFYKILKEKVYVFLDLRWYEKDDWLVLFNDWNNYRNFFMCYGFELIKVIKKIVKSFYCSKDKK